MSRSALIVALLLATLLPACKDSPIKPESPEDAARLWGKLLCDRREAVVKADVRSLKSQQEVALVRSKLVREGAAQSNTLEFLEAQLKYIEKHKTDIGTCNIEVLEKKEMDDGSKFRVDVQVAFRRMVRKDPELSLTESTFRLPVEVSRIDDGWYITGEPANVPENDALRLATP